MMTDVFGRPVEIGQTVVMNVSGGLVTGTVHEFRPKKASKQVGVRYTSGCDCHLPAMHDRTMCIDDAEWHIVRNAYELATSWQDAERLVIIPTGYAPVQGLPRPVPGGPLLVDWSSIPAKFNTVKMDQDLSFETHVQVPGQLEASGDEPDRIVPGMDYSDLDLGYWVPTHGSWDGHILKPWQILARPPYYEWRTAVCVRPAAT